MSTIHVTNSNVYIYNTLSENVNCSCKKNSNSGAILYDQNVYLVTNPISSNGTNVLFTSTGPRSNTNTILNNCYCANSTGPCSSCETNSNV